jgi:hypothetical protein
MGPDEDYYDPDFDPTERPDDYNVYEEEQVAQDKEGEEDYRELPDEDFDDRASDPWDEECNHEAFRDDQEGAEGP